MSLQDNLKELDTLRRLLLVGEQQAAFGQFIRHARKSRGMTQEHLADATGIAKSYLSQIETGYASPPRDPKVRQLARALGLDEEELLTRAHLAQLPDDVRDRIRALVDVFDSTEDRIRELLRVWREAGGTTGGGAETDGEAPAEDASIDLDALHRSGLLRHMAERAAWRPPLTPTRVRPIPVINKVAAGYPQEFSDLGYPVGVADEYIVVPADLEDPNAFGVRVVGDSMEPRYHEGDVVVFSPAKEVASGDDCFVRFSRGSAPGDAESTFKRVFFDAPEQMRLQPLNERYAPELAKPSDIEGIFRAVARYERLAPPDEPPGRPGARPRA